MSAKTYIDFSTESCRNYPFALIAGSSVSERPVSWGARRERDATKDARGAGVRVDDDRRARHGGGYGTGKSGGGWQIESPAGPPFRVAAHIPPVAQLAAVACRRAARAGAPDIGRGWAPEHRGRARDPRPGGAPCGRGVAHAAAGRRAARR